MNHPKLTIAILCVVLIFTGVLLRNWIPLSLDIQHDVGMIVLGFGLAVLFKIIVIPARANGEK